MRQEPRSPTTCCTQCTLVVLVASTLGGCSPAKQTPQPTPTLAAEVPRETDAPLDATHVMEPVGDEQTLEFEQTETSFQLVLGRDVDRFAQRVTGVVQTLGYEPKRKKKNNAVQGPKCRQVAFFEPVGAVRDAPSPLLRVREDLKVDKKKSGIERCGAPKQDDNKRTFEVTVKRRDPNQDPVARWMQQLADQQADHSLANWEPKPEVDQKIVNGSAPARSYSLSYTAEFTTEKALEEVLASKEMAHARKETFPEVDGDTGALTPGARRAIEIRWRFTPKGEASCDSATCLTLSVWYARCTEKPLVAELSFKTDAEDVAQTRAFRDALVQAGLLSEEGKSKTAALYEACDVADIQSDARHTRRPRRLSEMKCEKPGREIRRIGRLVGRGPGSGCRGG